MRSLTDYKIWVICTFLGGKKQSETDTYRDSSIFGELVFEAGAVFKRNAAIQLGILSNCCFVRLIYLSIGF